VCYGLNCRKGLCGNCYRLAFDCLRSRVLAGGKRACKREMNSAIDGWHYGVMAHLYEAESMRRAAVAEDRRNAALRADMVTL